MLNLSDIIDQCKNKKWDEMHMCFPFKEMFPAILMRACHEVHNPTSGYRLSNYDKNLMPGFGNGFASMLSMVNLIDFAMAHAIAKSYVCDDEMVKVIVNYVKDHVDVLGQLYDDIDEDGPALTEEIDNKGLRASLVRRFPFLADRNQKVEEKSQESLPSESQRKRPSFS